MELLCAVALLIVAFVPHSAPAQEGLKFEQLFAPLEVVVFDDELSQPLDYVTLEDGSLVYAVAHIPESDGPTTTCKPSADSQPRS